MAQERTKCCDLGLQFWLHAILRPPARRGGVRISCAERGWHGLYDGVVGRAELDTIFHLLEDYLALCGAGYSDDGAVLCVPHDRAIVLFWSLNDICGRRGNWEYKMEHLARDVSNLARYSHFAGPVIFVVGGSAGVWHLPVAFDVACDAVIKILRDHGCTKACLLI